MVRDFLPRVSAKLNLPFISDIIPVTYDGDTPAFARQVFNAKLATNIQSDTSSNTTLLSFQSAAFSSDDIELGGSDAASVFEVNLNNEDIKSISEPEFQESSSGVDLTTADLIVSVGRGIESEDNIPMVESLAEVMGAEIASSRPELPICLYDGSQPISTTGLEDAISAPITSAKDSTIGMLSSLSIPLPTDTINSAVVKSTPEEDS
jgi:electron transfer flavoprotein alpha subunit